MEHSSGHLLILSNHSATHHQAQGQQQAQPEAAPPSTSPDYALYTVPVAALTPGRGPQQWQLLQPEVPGTAVTDMDVFQGAVVLHTLNRSHPQLSVLCLAEGQDGTLAVAQQHEVSMQCEHTTPGQQTDSREPWV